MDLSNLSYAKLVPSPRLTPRFRREFSFDEWHELPEPAHRRRSAHGRSHHESGIPACYWSDVLQYPPPAKSDRLRADPLILGHSPKTEAGRRGGPGEGGRRS